MTQSDVLIVGGSLNGTMLALALAQGGAAVTVIDTQSRAAQVDNAFDGRSYALSVSSVRMLTALGLWDDLEEHAQPILEIKVSDGHAGRGGSPFVLHFDHAELEEGPMGHMVEDRHLRRAILARTEGTPGLTYLDATRVTDQHVTVARVEVSREAGKTLSAPLLVGADGRQGATALRAGIRRSVTDYGQTALVCAIGHERPHNGIAHQFFMPTGPLAILPLTKNRCSIVWSETAQQAAAIQALDDAAFLEVLRPRFGDFLGDIHLEGQRYSYPLNMTLANAFVSERFALVGDAARGVHPIAGQGLNAGLRDVAALAEVVLDARRRGEDWGSPLVLARYSRWRSADTASLSLATDGFNRLFSNDNPILRLGRDLGMGAVNSIPWMRRALMREAAGLTGDQPRLMRGERI